MTSCVLVSELAVEIWPGPVVNWYVSVSCVCVHENVLALALVFVQLVVPATVVSKAVRGCQRSW